MCDGSYRLVGLFPVVPLLVELEQSKNLLNSNQDVLVAPVGVVIPITTLPVVATLALY